MTLRRAQPASRAARAATAGEHGVEGTRRAERGGLDRAATPTGEHPHTQKNPHYTGGKMPDLLPEDNFVYFYHPDHLGSTSFATDRNGDLYEHVEYFPFGETWVDQHSNTQRLPYLFTSKELDEETGLYYFGARYYDPRTSVWQSADPAIGRLFDPHPGRRSSATVPENLALYTYSWNNPLFYHDPDGRMPDSAVWMVGAECRAQGARR